jgi:hypothetical protein
MNKSVLWKITEDDDILSKLFKGLINSTALTLSEVITYWYLYIPAFILAGFSGLGMWFVTGGRLESGVDGWMVTQQGNLLYVIIGVLFSEPYAVHWFVKVEVHENNSQAYAAYIGLIASLTTSILTGYTAAEIVARMTSGDIFTAYQRLDVWMQNYIVHLAPVAAFTHMLLAGWYRAASSEASAKRSIRKAGLDLKKSEADFDARIAEKRVEIARRDLMEVRDQLGEKLGHEDARVKKNKYALPTATPSSTLSMRPPQPSMSKKEKNQKIQPSSMIPPADMEKTLDEAMENFKPDISGDGLDPTHAER